MWLQSSHGKHVEKRSFRERGTSDAAPRSRHQKKALYFQTEDPRGSTLPGRRSAGSLLGFWRRPLQGGLRPLQLRRVITSVSSPYIPTLTYICLLWLIQLKTNPASLDSLTLFRLPSPELLLAVCWQLCVFSIHKRKTMRFFFEWTWNTEMWRSLQQTKWTATEVIVRSQQSFLVVTVPDCCCSTFPTFLSTVCFMSLLLVERCRVVGPLGSDPRGSRGTVKRWLGSPPR